MTPTCVEQVAEGEARASALHREVERLSVDLLKAQEEQVALKEKTTSLKRSLQETTASNSSTESRLAALHKTLSEAERLRRALQVSRTSAGGGETKVGVNQCNRVSSPIRSRWTRLGRRPQTPGGRRRLSLSGWRVCRAT